MTWAFLYLMFVACIIIGSFHTTPCSFALKNYLYDLLIIVMNSKAQKNELIILQKLKS